MPSLPSLHSACKTNAGFSIATLSANTCHVVANSPPAPQAPCNEKSIRLIGLRSDKIVHERLILSNYSSWHIVFPNVGAFCKKDGLPDSIENVGKGEIPRT